MILTYKSMLIFVLSNTNNTSVNNALMFLKSLAVWIIANCGEFLRRWKYQTTWPASKEICMQIKKQQLKLEMEQQTGSK